MLPPGRPAQLHGRPQRRRRPAGAAFCTIGSAPATDSTDTTSAISLSPRSLRSPGDFAHAIQLASKILATRGRIYPVTTANATLVARMDDGSLVRGETNITASHRRIAELMLDPPDAAALPETLEAIERADLITVGPGSLYTSLITNLLVQGIPPRSPTPGVCVSSSAT